MINNVLRIREVTMYFVNVECSPLYYKSRLKMYLPRHRGTMNETLIFFKIVSLKFNILIPTSFRLVEAPLNHLF